MWKTSWAWCMMRIGIYSKIKGIKFQKFNIATDENINGTTNYSMRDFELYLTGKITSYVFGSGNRGQSCNCYFYFLFSGWGYLFTEEAIKSGQTITDIHTEKSGSFLCALVAVVQLNYIIPICAVCPETSPSGQRSATLSWSFGYRTKGEILFAEASVGLKPGRMHTWIKQEVKSSAPERSIQSGWLELKGKK